MKSRTVTTMIMMMVVLLVVPLLNGHMPSPTPHVPTTPPPDTSSMAPTSQPQLPTTPTPQPQLPTTPTPQPQLPTTPATMNATGTPARTQTTGPAEVVCTSGTTSTKEDSTSTATLVVSAVLLVGWPSIVYLSGILH
ncbi:ESX-1 secretion-associated protein EspK-like isoform X1 [Sycon ciliatum]|uniref:ESX-1 secretion-associated protein EspK-like isoform X1 n=1 Tax=Sycon ciliatum TaxID=27933 RepID=UPI0031F61962